MKELHIDKSKDYYSIGEVSEILELDQHVIRFWCTKFSKFVKPIRKAGSRRYFTQSDIKVLKTIKELLYVKKFSIKGAHLLLSEKSSIDINIDLPNSSITQDKLEQIIGRLQEIQNKINTVLSTNFQGEK